MVIFLSDEAEWRFNELSAVEIYRGCELNHFLDNLIIFEKIHLLLFMLFVVISKEKGLNNHQKNKKHEKLHSDFTRSSTFDTAIM